MPKTIYEQIRALAGIAFGSAGSSGGGIGPYDSGQGPAVSITSPVSTSKPSKAEIDLVPGATQADSQVLVYGNVQLPNMGVRSFFVRQANSYTLSSTTNIDLAIGVVTITSPNEVYLICATFDFQYNSGNDIARGLVVIRNSAGTDVQSSVQALARIRGAAGDRLTAPSFMVVSDLPPGNYTFRMQGSMTGTTGTYTANTQGGMTITRVI